MGDIGDRQSQELFRGIAEHLRKGWVNSQTAAHIRPYEGFCDRAFLEHFAEALLAFA